MSRPGARLAASLLLLALPAGAARGASEAVPLPPRPPPALDRSEPAEDPRLDRLAELMGTLAFLRDLCGDGDGAAWRARMDALLRSEGTTDAVRDRLAGSYNRGYTGFQLTYHACTPAAEMVIARALDDGARLAADIAKAGP